MVHKTENDALYMYWGAELHTLLLKAPVRKPDATSGAVVKSEMLRSRPVERANRVGSSFGEQMKFFSGQHGCDGRRDQK